MEESQPRQNELYIERQPDLRKIGLILLGLAVLLSAGYLLFQQRALHLADLALSADHQISPAGQHDLTLTFYFAMALLAVLGGGCILAQDRSWRERFKQTLLREPVVHFASIRPSPRFTLIVTTLAGLALILCMRLATRSPALYQLLYARERGILDLGNPLFWLISAVLMGISVWGIIKAKLPGRMRLVLILVYLLALVLFFVYAGEEINWGQAFFRWATPGLFAGNVEHETNLHNFLNAYFDPVYIGLSGVLLVLLFSTWMEFNRHALPYNRLILPHPSLIGLSILIAYVAIVWFHEQELLEEMMGVFVLFYSLRLFAITRSNKLNY